MDSRIRTPTQIYDFLVEVTHPKDGEASKVRCIYPKDYEISDELKKQIPMFVWPMRTLNDQEEHFTFVLTDLDSKYKFGFCRYPPKGETCMCFLSDLPWYKIFYRSLDKISDLMLNHQMEVVEPFLKGLYLHPIPNLGVDTVLSIVPSEVDSGHVYSFPLPNPRKLSEIPTDDNLTQFYTNLHYNVILHLFANMIFERRIIITSKSLSTLSATVHGAVLLLYPLLWQHIFIPITPPHLLEYCAAPMPFLIGVHSSYMDIVRRMPTDDIVILDVDESTIESAHVDDLTTLPIEVISTLKHVLKKQSSAYGDTVTRSFMLAQVAMIGGYRSALKLRQGEKDIVFDEDQFLLSRPNMEDFLGQLLHFQHFRQFIQSKIDKLKSRKFERDLFDNEVMAYEDEMKGTEQMKAVFDRVISSTVESSKKIAELSGKLGGNIRKQVKQARIVMKKKKHKSQVHSYSNRYYDGGAFSTSEKKTNSLPNISTFNAGHTIPPLVLGQKPRKPPPVIPYHRHIEGKKKLAHSLQQQSSIDVISRAGNLTPPNTPSRASSGADMSSLDQIDEVVEVISLDSKEDAEEMGFADHEVAVADLIDISSDPAGPSSAVENAQQNTTLDSASSSSIVSTASSSDISDTQVSPHLPRPTEPQQNWEQFDDESLPNRTSPSFDRPPLPPPRSELEELYSKVSPRITTQREESPLVSFVIDTPPEPDPFAALQTEIESHSRPKSPFEDFSSSVAEALITNSEREEDPASATTLATAGKKLFELVVETEESDSLSALDTDVVSSASVLQPTNSSELSKVQSSPVIHPTTAGSPNLSNSISHASTPVLEPILQPVSAGSSTSALSTAHARTDLHTSSHNPHSRSPSNSKHNNHQSGMLKAMHQKDDIFGPESIANNTNPFYSGSINAGNYPALVPLSQRPMGPRSPSYVQNHSIPGNNTKNMAQKQPGRAPPKPQPYSGKGSQNQDGDDMSKTSNDVVLRRRPSSGVQRLPSLGAFDPFADFLSSEGEMAGYVQENKNASPLV